MSSSKAVSESNQSGKSSEKPIHQPGRVFEVVRDRRAIRSFTDREIPDDALKVILESAIWAPTGSNEQAWYFIVVRNRKLIEKIKAVTPGMLADENPAVVVVACRDKRRAYEVADVIGRDVVSPLEVAMAVQNMLLVAWDMGIGSCPKASIDVDALRIILKLPEHIEPVLLVTFGYPAEVPEPPPRRGLEEVVRYEE